MGKAILILLDACGNQVAKEQAGYIEHLVELKRAARYTIKGGLPSLSRPMYESMLTGLDAIEHGISNNTYTRSSDFENLFSLTKEQGKTNAAAAYGWVSELYNKNGPFNLYKHRIQLESTGDIEHGIFYCQDNYPDSHLIMDGEMLRQMYHPDFLFMHSMNIDFNGHRFGSDSKEYRAAVSSVFDVITSMIDIWVADGYDIVITADHGMDEWGMHGGTSDIQRDVPLYIISEKVKKGRFERKEISNLNIAPLLCELIGIVPAEGMKKDIEVELV